MARIDDVPRADRDPQGPVAPREVTFETFPRVRRRGFLAVVATGAMTLGVTALSWVPLARPARAEPGSEYRSCGRYDDGPGGPLCSGGYPYSEDYCGDDDWFRNGCFEAPDGHVDCYRPLTICEAGDDGGRNAWRWKTDDAEWRCADGELQHEGAPNPETVICSARLPSPGFPTQPPPPPSSPDPPPSSTPTEPTPPFAPLPALPALPLPPLRLPGLGR